MTTAARLTADLTANTAAFEEGMKRAGQSLLSFQNIAKVTFESELFKEAFEKLAEGLKELTTGAFEAIDATAKMARSLGENISEFQAQSQVFKEAGVDQEAYARAIGTSQKALFSAAEGSKQASKAFQLLNLDVGELIKLRPDQQFAKIADALSKIQNPTERTALALEIFGKNGRAIIPVIDNFSHKLDEARAFQDKFNIALTEVDARKVEAAKETMGRVKDAISGLGNTIAKEAAPLVTTLGQDLLNAGVDGKTFGNTVHGAVEFVADGIDEVRKAVLGMGAMFLEIERGIDNLYASAADKLATIASYAENLPYIGDKFTGDTDKFTQLASQFRKDGAQLTLGIAEANKEAENFETTMDKINKIQTQQNVNAAEGEKQWQSFGGSVNNAFDMATAGAKKFNSAMTDTDAYAKKLDDEIGRDFNDIVQGAYSGTLSLKQLENEAVKLLSTIFQQQAFGADGGGFSFGGLFSGIGSLFSGIFGGLPSFDVGTDYVPQDMVAQIHKGEAIIPASQNRGGDFNVQIINNSSARVTAKQVPTPSGPSLKVMVDEMQAQNIADPRSKTREMMRVTHGVAPLLTQR